MAEPKYKNLPTYPRGKKPAVKSPLPKRGQKPEVKDLPLAPRKVGMYKSPSAAVAQLSDPPKIKPFSSPLQPKTKPGYVGRELEKAAKDELKGSVGLGKGRGSATTALGIAKKAASYKARGK